MARPSPRSVEASTTPDVAATYTFEQLPGLAPTVDYGTAYDINSAGDVVGSSIAPLPPSVWHPVLWRNGDSVATDLGVPYGDDAEAYAVNDAAHVVGASGFKSVSSIRAGFLWRQGVFTLIRPSNPRSIVRPTDINNRDEVVGGMQVVFPPGWRAFRYTASGQLKSIHPAGSNYRVTWASSINDAGIIVGYVDLANGERHLARWSANDVFTDLGAPVGYSINPTGINARGEIVGEAVPWGGTLAYPFVWRSGVGFAVGAKAGGASGVSDRGRIVGWAGFFDYPMTKKGGPPSYLPLGTNVYGTAYGVNTCGDIVGRVSTVRVGVFLPVRWKIDVCD